MRVLLLTAAILAGLAIAPLTLVSADHGAGAEYVGGTLEQIAGNCDGKLRTNDPDVLQFVACKNDIRVAYERINLLEYGQKVDRRYVIAVMISPLFLLSKSRRHYLTVGYQDESGRQQAMVFRVDKSKVRAVLVSLEARTGRKVQYQDDEARKAGKG
jgi:hypothetical protein